MTSNVPDTKATDAALSPSVNGSEPSVGELVTSALDDVSALVKHEIDLAKAELTFSIKNGGLAAGLIGAAGFLLLMSVIMLSVAFAYFLHMTGLDLAWCFLIVWGAYTLIAVLLGVVAWTRFKFIRPPKRAIEQAKETKTALMSRKG